MDRFLMVGRQHLYLSLEEAKNSSILRPFAEKLEGLRSASGGYSEAFLRELGAGEVESLDYSGYEGATLLHDLNQPVPMEWEQGYDLILDGGSLEHVFQYPTALASCMRMVKRGGHFVTIAPSNNFSGHGLYQFSAELFFRVFSRENGFSLPLVALAEARSGGRIYRIDDPAKLRHRVLFGGKGPLILLVVARRDEICPLFTNSPVQSDYADFWRSGAGSQESPKRRLATLRSFLPFSLLQRYDLWRIERRRRREASRGVHQVNSLAEAFHDVKDLHV